MAGTGARVKLDLMMGGEESGELECESAMHELSVKARKLRSLRELHALKLANQSLKEDVEQLKARVEESQREVMTLLMKVEHFSGKHETLRHEILAVRSAVRGCEPSDLMESAA